MWIQMDPNEEEAEWRCEIAVIGEKESWPSNIAHPLFPFIPSRTFLQYCYCNISFLTHIAILYAHMLTHSHRGFTGLNSCTFDLLKNEWASEMRWEAKVEGRERGVRRKKGEQRCWLEKWKWKITDDSCKRYFDRKGTKTVTWLEYRDTFFEVSCYLAFWPTCRTTTRETRYERQ